MLFRSRSLVASYNSVREHQPGISYLPTIPFGSINPESRIFLRFCSGVSTRSLVFFLRFHSRNVTIFRIKVLEGKSKKKSEKKENSKKKIEKKIQKEEKKKRNFDFSRPGQNMRLFVFTIFLILSNA